MVIVQKIELNPIDKTATVSLFADAKADVTDDMEITGFPEGYTIAPGSSVMTASAELAFRKSDGTWNW